MSSHEKFEREELQCIRDRAFSLSRGTDNTCWKRALVELGDVTNKLDAMIARVDADQATEATGHV